MSKTIRTPCNAIFAHPRSSDRSFSSPCRRWGISYYSWRSPRNEKVLSRFKGTELGKRQIPDTHFVRPRTFPRRKFFIKNGRRPASAPETGHTFCPLSRIFGSAWRHRKAPHKKEWTTEAVHSDHLQIAYREASRIVSSSCSSLQTPKSPSWRSRIETPPCSSSLSPITPM